MIFVQNLVVILSTLTLFVLCGWSVIAPFGRQIAFPAACAALSGLVLLPCAVLAVHVVLLMTYWKAALAASGVLASASLIAVYVFGRQDLLRELPHIMVVTVALAVCATLTVTRTDLFFGGPGLLYSHGTDHLGYAQMADWIRMRIQNSPLTLSQDDVYGSFPDILLNRDPRFGTFSLLALISTISGRPGAFAYDLTCAIVLTVTSIGVSAAFSRTRSVLVLLAVALFVSVWFDFGRLGYLGKIVGFPATLLVVGLFFEFHRQFFGGKEFPLAALGAVAATVICAAITFNALLTALALAVFGSAFLIAHLIWEKRDSYAVHQIGRSGLILVALIGLAIVSSGMIARPMYFSFIPLDVGWKALTDWAIQVVDPVGIVGPLFLVGPSKIIIATIFVGICILAIVMRSAAATALAVGTIVVGGALYAFDQRWRFYEITPLFVATPACAAAILLNGELFLAGRLRFYSLFGLFLLVPVGLGLPRYAAGLAYFGGGTTPSLYRFSLEETDRLAAAVDSTGAVIDVGEKVHFNIFLLVELGRRGIPFQLSETSWRASVGYRPWPFPRYDKPMPIAIVLRSEENTASPRLLMRTTQFDVMRQP
jgi:hypothetical protein